MLHVFTWLWGDKFALDDVTKLAAGVRRNLKQPHRFVLVTDDMYRKGIAELGVAVVPIIRDLPLTKTKGCFARLRQFDPGWQFSAGIGRRDRLATIDLDTIITGQLDPLFNRPEPFVIMQGANKTNPCPMNGALMLLQAGACAQVWSEFTLEKARRIPAHDFPDDQGWIWHMLPQAAGWEVGPKHGVYVWQKRGWPGGEDLPKDARLVTFVNKSPRDIAHLDWVNRHWTT